MSASVLAILETIEGYPLRKRYVIYALDRSLSMIYLSVVVDVTDFLSPKKLLACKIKTKSISISLVALT